LPEAGFVAGGAVTGADTTDALGAVGAEAPGRCGAEGTEGAAGAGATVPDGTGAEGEGAALGAPEADGQEPGGGQGLVEAEADGLALAEPGAGGAA
jgi:hypothetical protein